VEKERDSRKRKAGAYFQKGREGVKEGEEGKMGDRKLKVTGVGEKR